MGFELLPLDPMDSLSSLTLPQKTDHKDPLDRMLIWQAIIKNMMLISKDASFTQYKNDGLKLMW
jgi:PIN domain nuclease of toxin-antitoxin system